MSRWIMRGNTTFAAHQALGRSISHSRGSDCGEWGRTIVAEGFAALETMPDWYQYTLGVIVAASFGVRSATKFFGNKK